MKTYSNNASLGKIKSTSKLLLQSSIEPLKGILDLFENKTRLRGKQEAIILDINKLRVYTYQLFRKRRMKNINFKAKFNRFEF